MSRTAIARQGDTLDAICWRELGTTQGNVVEDALTLNPGLAASGTVLAEGTVVMLPDPPAAAAALLETVNLWD
ncbi:tail protein X [Novosphingobium beihaiensis]|uniref:Tail protein X n=1 Tax=Novosphingobium beihaiensis TaxID=2930389 RepID=A0ABT0BVS9_9SPHN|nr:tail protein X [Novosphingobium beihaiensis]MCJ2189159.1 tail protein X [Novosphingobium beihaiensis]